MLDDKWYFHRGDIQIEKPYWIGPVYTQGKTKRKLNGPAAYAYEDAPDQYAFTKSALLNHEWREVIIPRTEHWICFYRKKGAFYQNQSHWMNEPMVHIVPHWNFEGL